MDGGIVAMQVQDLVITELSIGGCVHGEIWSQRIRKLYPSKNTFFFSNFSLSITQHILHVPLFQMPC